ncbi:MAG: hypothetical protein K0S07_496 [Chlamydiales bacterium]|jgi:tetratricopeptide (TPR) repeat protein|nr:hypothetical protein [Chlamydiales bacterium]
MGPVDTNTIFTQSSQLNSLEEHYKQKYQELAVKENWSEIIAEGKKDGAIMEGSDPRVACKIYRHVASCCHYKGLYEESREIAEKIKWLGERLIDRGLQALGLYLQSASERAMAINEKDEEFQQIGFQTAIHLVEDAYSLVDRETNLDEVKGKVFFNWGAALADNPKGNLKLAIEKYHLALEYYKNADQGYEMARTKERLAEAYFKMNDLERSSELLQEVKAETWTRRLTMLVENLESQIKERQGLSLEAMALRNSSFILMHQLGAAEPRTCRTLTEIQMR